MVPAESLKVQHIESMFFKSSGRSLDGVLMDLETQNLIAHQSQKTLLANNLIENIVDRELKSEASLNKKL